MPFCVECGYNMSAGLKICPICQSPVKPMAAASQSENPQKNETKRSAGFSAENIGFEVADAAIEKLTAVCSYLGILLAVPLLSSKKTEFVRFHANQGIVLLAVFFAAYVISALLSNAFASAGLIFISAAIPAFLWISAVVFIFFGVVSAASGKLRPLPLIGKISILK